MNAYTLEPPIKWRAGCTYKGDREAPFYFDCAGCDAQEPEIAGFIGRDGVPQLGNVGVIKTEDGFYKTAMYCADCWAKKLEEIK